MAIKTRVLELLAITLCLQCVASLPDFKKNEETSETFSLTNTASSLWSFENCRLAATVVTNHLKEIHSVALEYVQLTSHVTTQTLNCVVSNENGIIKCISGVMKENEPSYDLLQNSFKALLKSLLGSIKDLLLCAFT